MNTVILIGRLTADPDVRYGQDSGKAVASFTVAVNRRGQDAGADFIRCKAFDKTAENIGKFFSKGSQIGVNGSINTGSYKDRDGKTVYTTDVLVNSFEFVGSKGDSTQAAPKKPTQRPSDNDFIQIPDDVSDEGLPFN